MTAASTGTAPAGREPSRLPHPKCSSHGYRACPPDAVRVVEHICLLWPLTDDRGPAAARHLPARGVVPRAGLIPHRWLPERLG